MFNNKYPANYISQSVSGIEKTFPEFVTARNITKPGRDLLINNGKNLDIFVDIGENPQQPTRQQARL